VVTRAICSATSCKLPLRMAGLRLKYFVVAYMVMFCLQHKTETPTIKDIDEYELIPVKFIGICIFMTEVSLTATQKN